MKMNISHPYKDNITLSFGQFTQVVGQDQQLKYYIWQTYYGILEAKNIEKKI